MKYLICLLVAFTHIAFGAETSFKINFEQSYKSKLTNKVKTSKGELKYSYPKKIRIDISNPDPIIFVSNGKKSWYYRAPFIEGEPGEVVINQGGENLNLLANFFDLLQKGLKDNDQYKVQLADTEALLTFSDSYSKKFKMKKALLVFSDTKKTFDKVQKMSLTYANDEVGEFSITSFQHLPFEAKVFEFDIPKNTKISQ